MSSARNDLVTTVARILKEQAIVDFEGDTSRRKERYPFVFEPLVDT